MGNINEELVYIEDSITLINQEIADIQNTIREILEELKKGQSQEPPHDKGKAYTNATPDDNWFNY